MLSALRSNIATQNWKYKLFQLLMGYHVANHITLYNMESYATGIDVANIIGNTLVEKIIETGVSYRGRKRMGGPDVPSDEPIFFSGERIIYIITLNQGDLVLIDP